MKKNIRRLLVAIDFSAASAHAMEYAAWLALQLSADLVAVHIYPPLNLKEATTNETRSQLEKQRHDPFLQKLKRFASIYPDREQERLTAVGKVRCRVSGGQPVSGILSVAAEEEADLILVGTRSKHNLWDHLFGSFTTNLISRSSRPVLVIPEGAKFKNIRKIAFATEISLRETFVYEWLMHFSASLGAETERFYVNVLPGEQKKFKEEVILATWGEDDRSGALERITMIREENVPGGIHYYLEKYPAEMIALYVPQRAFIDNLLHRSLSKQLAYRSQLPLLIIKDIRPGQGYTPVE